MARRIALLAALATLALPGLAGAATPARFFAGVPLDGPSADIQSLGDLDVARDGTGALAYVKRVGGVDHIFVSRLVNGAFQAPEQVDAGLAGAGAQPVVAASDGGRLVVAFVSGGAIFTAVRPAGAPGYAALQQISTAGSSPAVDMSINGVAYLAYSSGGDLQSARLERNATSFNGLPGPLDIDPAATAGEGADRPKIAVAADGVATVVWGEGPNVYARRLFELRPSAAPQAVAENADEPDISSEDDSSYAWVVVRQGSAIARRLVGSQFDPPVTLEANESVESPRVAINGRGIGYAGIGGAGTLNAYGAVLKDDVFNPAVMLGGSIGAAPAAVPAVAETGDGLVAFQAGDAGGGRTVHARTYDYVPASRVVTPPGPDATLSDPAYGPTDAARGLEAAADRAGDVAVAFVQGDGDSRRIMVASYDRAPGAFRANTTTKWRKFARPPMKWGTAFELWGPITYRVEIDGKPVGTTTSTGLTVPTTVPDGLHRWRVVAVDIHGQSTATPTRNMRVDATAPKVSFRVSGTRKRGKQVKVAVKATDASGTLAKASGLNSVRISFGDGSRAVTALRAAHRYGHSGKVTVRVSATDKAGNAVALTRRITIRK